MVPVLTDIDCCFVTSGRYTLDVEIVVFWFFVAPPSEVLQLRDVDVGMMSKVQGLWHIGALMIQVLTDRDSCVVSSGRYLLGGDVEVIWVFSQSRQDLERDWNDLEILDHFCWVLLKNINYNI